jgi:hypothetical protein
MHSATERDKNRKALKSRSNSVATNSSSDPGTYLLVAILYVFLTFRGRKERQGGKTQRPQVLISCIERQSAKKEGGGGRAEGKTEREGEGEGRKFVLGGRGEREAEKE